ncbi:DgyrCDS5780 [Dimorphilus gyrociliatus]|uniref:DgyrCDS5780 n=1 Tax=Dimorphilus gyrociliatus TaxID=2664684 RepID=A0A7I8VL24_9ANNE|nr:DgyrCDS5780 [Dimorphilus gyrociliatus]
MQTFRCLCLVMGGADLLFTAKVPYEASKFVLKDLAKNYAKTAVRELNKRNASNAFDDWVWWIFRDLPFSHLVRIFDCFLVDGRKFLYRVALVLLKLFFKSNVNKEDSLKISDQMRHFFSEIPLSAEQLLRKSYKIRLTRAQVRKLEKKNEMYVKSLRHQSYDKNALKKSESCESLNIKVSRSFSGPILSVYDETDLKAERRRSFQSLTALPFTSSSSLLLDIAHWRQIYSWIPIRISLLIPKLLYSTMENGSSLQMMYSLIEGYEPTLIIVKTTQGFIIGGYCSADWAERKTFKNSMSYFGTGESFVFTLEPSAKKFAWQGIGKTNASNDTQYFQAGDNSKLTIGGGGGEALQLDENLTKGRSEKCSTFDNEPLVEDSDFVCSIVEVFGFNRDN